ncbi:MAG: WbuC family cupin fold metalloprotein [Akkermansiaceae bacterium]
MSNTYSNPSGDIFTLSDSVLSRGRKASGSSSRLRVIQPIHRTQDARVQRLLNFLQPGTYIQPHCHPLPHASESVIVMSGRLEVLIFDDGGSITKRHLLTPENPLIDIEPNIWHGMIVLEEDTTILEFKQGPYDAATDKLFARWAPAEGGEEASAYLESLISNPG